MRIILASGSPRRKEILASFGVDFEIISPDCDENISYKTPSELVEKLSLIKAEAVANITGTDDTFILAADTVVALGNTVLGKPSSKEDAYNMLSSLSGKCHSVYTGITAIINGVVSTTHDKTDVYFKKLTKQEILDYIETDEPYDKAGSYALQGIGKKFVEKIDGSYSCVVGLSEEKVKEFLISAKIIEK